MPERVAAVATAVAASIVVIAIAILPFLTPAWVSFEQGRTHAASLTGYTEADLTQFFSGLSLTVPTVTSVGVDGATNAPTGPSAHPA